MNKVSFLNRRAIFLPCLLMPLFGFTDFIFKGSAIDDAHDHIEKVSKNTHPNIMLDNNINTGSLTPYVPYQFEAVNEDPFVIKNFVARLGADFGSEFEDLCQDDDCGDGPPAPHAKYFLENYNLDQLAMIGSMFDRQRGKVALIQTPDVGIIYTSVGEYIGRNNGLILSIDKDQMLVREKYRSPKGWQDRMAKLPLLKK